MLLKSCLRYFCGEFPFIIVLPRGKALGSNTELSIWLLAVLGRSSSSSEVS
jgi:hypothetical protein